MRLNCLLASRKTRSVRNKVACPLLPLSLFLRLCSYHCETRLITVIHEAAQCDIFNALQAGRHRLETVQRSRDALQIPARTTLKGSKEADEQRKRDR